MTLLFALLAVQSLIVVSNAANTPENLNGHVQTSVNGRDSISSSNGAHYSDAMETTIHTSSGHKFDGQKRHSVTCDRASDMVPVSNIQGRQTCEKLFSQGSCQDGYRIVYDPDVAAYQCQKNPCDQPDAGPRFPLRNGTCVSENISEWELKGYCSENEDPVLTESGRIDCECSRPRFFLYPDDGGCYELYKKGPCKEDEILEFVPSEQDSSSEGAPTGDRTLIAQCAKNVCARNHDPAAAYWKKDGKCYELETQGPCKVGHIFSIDPRTHIPDCVHMQDQLQMSLDPFPVPSTISNDVACRLGSVRSAKRSCLDSEVFPDDPDRPPLFNRHICRRNGEWIAVNPSTRQLECLPVPCVKNGEFLTTNGQCMNEEAFGKWCSSVRGTKMASPKGAMTVFGTVECECLGDDLAFWPEDGRCYKLYTKGPCQNDHQVLAYTGSSGVNNGLECIRNPCNESGFAVSNKDKKCYPLGSEGPCDPLDWDILIFKIDPVSLIPACTTRNYEPPAKTQGVSSSLEEYQPCKPGSERDFNGVCKPTWEFTSRKNLFKSRGPRCPSGRIPSPINGKCIQWKLH